MFLICFSLLAFHSLSKWHRPLKNIHHNSKVDTLTNTFSIDQPGFHEISDVKSGDSINVKFNNQNLRLFLFLLPNVEIGLKSLNIDGFDALSHITDLEDRYAFAIDANQEAIFQFEKMNHENQHNLNHTFHNHIRDHILKRKSKKTIKERVKRMISKLKFDHQHYENYDDDDFDFHFDQLNVVLWLLPRDMCGKSSIYEYGGANSNITVKPTTSIITSKTTDEITYSNCIFSPLFSLFNTKSVFDVSIGVRPTESDNYYPQSYKSSTTSIYTDNYNNPNIIINGHQDNGNLTLSKPFFARYEIKQQIIQGQSNSPLTVETFLNRKVPETDAFDIHSIDIFCTSGSVNFCDTKSCFHDDQIELKLTQKCIDDLIWQIIALISGIAIFILIVIIILSCLCCVGCCALCGFCCCGCCNGRFCFKKRENQANTSPIAVSQRSRRRRNDHNESEQDLEVPLMSVDQGQYQGQYHQPSPGFYPQQPVFYVQQPGVAVPNVALPYQQQQQQQLQPNVVVAYQQQQPLQPNVVVYPQQQQQHPNQV